MYPYFRLIEYDSFSGVTDVFSEDTEWFLFSVLADNDDMLTNLELLISKTHIRVITNTDDKNIKEGGTG